MVSSRRGSFTRRVTELSVLALLAIGCTGNSADSSLDNQISKNPSVQRVNVGRFAGTVTIDGQPPNKPDTVLVMALIDPKKPTPPNLPPKMWLVVDPEGNFDFSTYTKSDGVEVGSYVAIFAQMHNLLGGGMMLMRQAGRGGGYGPPDDLKNLYNDPDKNAQDPDMKVEITSPGRTDWRFDLKVEGKEPNRTPGPHALTKIEF